MQLSCSVAPGPSAVGQIRLAEELGYTRAWIYDSPALYWDVWVTLGRLATETTHIGLGVGVLVPTRDVFATATAVATVEAMAPGRFSVALATGFTGQLLLGERPLPWATVATFLRDLRTLLRGESIVRGNEHLRLGQPAGWLPAAPISTPLLVAAVGPKGLAVARELADGLMVMMEPEAPGFDWCAMSVAGTVLADGEAPGDQRVMDALGASISMIYRYTYEAVGPDAVDALPGGVAWRAAVEAVEPTARRLEMHSRTAIGATERERAWLSPDLVPMTFTGSPHQLRERVKYLADRGVTEVVYAASGPDVDHELRSMAAAING